MFEVPFDKLTVKKEVKNEYDKIKDEFEDVEDEFNEVKNGLFEECDIKIEKDEDLMTRNY